MSRAYTTFPPTTKSPEAVPLSLTPLIKIKSLTYKSSHRFVLDPKLIAPSVLGIILVVKSVVSVNVPLYSSSKFAFTFVNAVRNGSPSPLFCDLPVLIISFAIILSLR